MEATHTFSFDETPTPTRFIRNCEEIGLFQDLQHNPFDETFRVAVETSSSDLSNILREPLSKQAEESLNTPKIIAVSKCEKYQNVYSIMEEDDNEFVMPDAFLIESIDPESSPMCNEKDGNSDDCPDVEVIEEPVHENGFINEIETSQPTNITTIVSALTTNPSNITYTISSHSAKNRIGNFIVQNGSSLTSASSNSFCSNTNSKQFVIQKSVISTNKDKNEKKTNTSSVAKNVTSKESDFLYQLSSTKLPAVLSGKNVVILPSRNNFGKSSMVQPIKAAVKYEEPKRNINGDSQVKEKLRNLLRTNSSQLVGEPLVMEEYTGTGRESSSSGNSMVDEKREYSRERNRMAQKRCRMKKKRWIMQLKKETEVVLNENQNLQVEVSSLRAEIAHLKTLLLAHRNCSVTRAMYKADLSAILNNDISKIADNVEISVPDSTDECDEARIKVNNIVSHHQQLNQISHHVNHIHVHVPPLEDTLDSTCGAGKSNQSLTLVRQIKPTSSQLTQNRKLIFDSKVVPIKPDDRSASVLQKSRSNVLTIRNIQEAQKQLKESSATTERRGRKGASKVISDNMPMQSTEVSGSTNGNELEQQSPKVGNIFKWNPILRVEKVDL